VLANGGIGFDDLDFAPASHVIIAPMGGANGLALIDPETLAVTPVGATKFEAAHYAPGHHDDGVTSAAETPEAFVYTDRNTKTIIARDRTKHDVVLHSALAAEPDYVRYVAVARELWVTEPAASQIEIYSLTLQSIAKLPVPGGPESLVTSPSRHMAYANLWHQKTVEIDITKRAIARTFDTKCEKTRGIALDDANGNLFVACNDGRIVRVELASGKITAEGRAGDGVDIIDFSPKTGHLYVPASRAGTLTIFTAALSIVKTEPARKGAHCVVADDHAQAWVCDPDHGSLVVYAENP